MAARRFRYTGNGRRTETKKTVIELLPIGADDLDNPRAQAAFALYQDVIQPETRIPVEQIRYWIARSDPLRFCCLSITLGTQVVGYVQYSHDPAARVILVEYLCLDKKNFPRIMGRQSIQRLGEFMLSRYDHGTSVLLEVAATRSEGDWQSDDGRIAYFMRHGFERCPFPYRCPAPGGCKAPDGRPGIPADLMQWTGARRTNLAAPDFFEKSLPAKGTGGGWTMPRFLEMLRHILFDRYLGWERPFLDDLGFQARRREIDELFQHLLRSLPAQAARAQDGAGQS